MAPRLKRAAIAEPWPRVHDLRHTAASLAISAGAQPKAVQEMLSHASVTLTLGTYVPPVPVAGGGSR